MVLVSFYNGQFYLYAFLFIRPYAQIGPRTGKRKEARGKTERQRQRQRGGAERQEANLPGRPGRIKKTPRYGFNRF